MLQPRCVLFCFYVLFLLLNRHINEGTPLFGVRKIIIKKQNIVHVLLKTLFNKCSPSPAQEEEECKQ